MKSGRGYHRRLRFFTTCPECDRLISTIADAGLNTKGEWIKCETCETPRLAKEAEEVDAIDTVGDAT